MRTRGDGQRSPARRRKEQKGGEKKDTIGVVLHGRGKRGPARTGYEVKQHAGERSSKANVGIKKSENSQRKQILD